MMERRRASSFWVERECQRDRKSSLFQIVSVLPVFPVFCASKQRSIPCVPVFFFKSSPVFPVIRPFTHGRFPVNLCLLLTALAQCSRR